VLHPRPCVSRLKPDFCTSARVFAIRPPQGSLSSWTFAFGYPSSLPNWDWTCSLIRTLFRLTLDANLKVGTLAERTSKQPGRARHTTNESTHTFQSRALLALKRWSLRSLES